jgi:putative heme-binding domain-containing protein
MDDPTWPDRYNQVPMMTDWGRSMVYLHPVTPDGASFQQEEEVFLEVPQITDLDVDASGRMYLSAWDGAGFRGDSSKGFVLRAVPREWSYSRFPDLDNLSIDQLAGYMKTGSGAARLNAQQELITRPAADASEALWEIASGKDLPLQVRVAGLFGYTQVAGESSIDDLVALTEEEAMREFALRALADRKGFRQNVPLEPFLDGLTDPLVRVKVAATVGLGRLGRVEAADALLQTPMPPSFATPAPGTEGPHALPNAAVILPHAAVRALASLHAVDACIEAIGGEHSDLALWALRYMHEPKAVDALIAAYESSDDDALKRKLTTTLARIYHNEAPYDGSWWWGTRPDTHGPYYKAIDWEASETIRAFLLREWSATDPGQQAFYVDLNEKYRLDIPEFAVGEEMIAGEESPAVDLTELANARRGQIGRNPIEDVMLAIAEIEPDTVLGRQLFAQRGCEVCHNLTRDEVMKGPFMGQIGSIMSLDQIAEAILTPNASISQGFATALIVTKGGESYIGFVSEESAETLKLRNIDGQVFTLDVDDIQSRRELENSMMPEGLTNSLSFEEFASLVAFLSLQK